ncbi:hypothetical protein [Streptomyces sp. NPDC001889]
MTGSVIPLTGGRPPRPPARLVLDAWLRHDRRQGRSAPDQETARHLAAHKGPVFTDQFDGAAGRLTAVEARAVHVGAYALGPIWPSQWGGEPSAPRPQHSAPRPWPRSPMTLVLLDSLLARIPDCPQSAARRLDSLADRADATGLLDVRVLSQHAPEGWALAGGVGALCSRIALLDGRTLYVRENYVPTYWSSADGRDRAMDAVLDTAVAGTDAIAALRHAAAQHRTSRCPNDAGPGCSCPSGSEPVIQGRAVTVVVRHRDRVVLVPGGGGRRALPTTTIGERESAERAALRAVEPHTRHAVVTGHWAAEPGRPLHVLCTVPDPALLLPGTGAVWADARDQAGLPAVLQNQE